MITQKQFGYAMSLLKKKGFNMRFVNAEYRKLGLGMRERSGTTKDYLNGLTSFEASQLIKKLQEL